MKKIVLLLTIILFITPWLLAQEPIARRPITIPAGCGSAPTLLGNSVGTDSASGTVHNSTAMSTTTGNSLWIGFRIGSTSATISSVVDTAGNTYSLAKSQTVTTDHIAYVYYATNITANASNVITITISSSATCRLAVGEVNGANNASPIDQSASSSGAAGTALNSGNITTTCANELLLGLGSQSNGAILTAGSSFTNFQTIPTGAGNERIAFASRTVSSTGTYAATWTSGATVDWGAIVIGVKS